MKSLRWIIMVLLMLLVSLTSPLWSGTTGKVAGTITDKVNGEPLIGANIVVIGTSLGAVTDIDGNYSILYIPPGTYNIQISFIGYRKSIVNNVRVYIDQTARIDFPLEPQAVEMGDIIVVAERKTIKPDVATSVAAVSDKEVESMPISNVISAIGLQAGVRHLLLWKKDS